MASAETLSLPIRAALKPGSLAILFATAKTDDDAALEWDVVPVDETSYGYFVRAPNLRTAAVDRLTYFARYLEHADAAIAADAYGEFARAPYDQVAAVADRLHMADLRSWLASEGVPQERKGLYGMTLGLATSADDRRQNAELLRSLIEAPADDFRAGFDGVLAGYLLLEGEPGLELIERRMLANPDAKRGDVLHAMSALRFYQESGHGISKLRLAAALAHLLARPDSAASTITDLARWEAWHHLPKVVALFDHEGFDDAPTRRAVVGYLLACPNEDARRELSRLRRQSPERVAEAEESLRRFGGPRT